MKVVVDGYLGPVLLKHIQSAIEENTVNTTSRGLTISDPANPIRTRAIDMSETFGQHPRTPERWEGTPRELRDCPEDPVQYWKATHQMTIATLVSQTWTQMKRAIT